MDRIAIEQRVREVLASRTRLSGDVAALAPDQSLYEAGMTSHATVKVMLGLEDAFDIEFPDELLDRSIFDRIETISDAIQKLLSDR